jgi:hypothetical protein
MRSHAALSAIAVIATLLPWASPKAEETYVNAMRGWVVIHERGAKNSDSYAVEVELLDAKRKLIARLPRLVGPVLVASTNAQLLSCESNAVLKGRAAKVYSLAGKEVFNFEHLGFLRGCGITGDGRVYWLHYNVVRQGAPWNIVVLLDRTGSVLTRQEFREARSVPYEIEGARYTLPIPAAELPG